MCFFIIWFVFFKIQIDTKIRQIDLCHMRHLTYIILSNDASDIWPKSIPMIFVPKQASLLQPSEPIQDKIIENKRKNIFFVFCQAQPKLQLQLGWV